MVFAQISVETVPLFDVARTFFKDNDLVAAHFRVFPNRQPIRPPFQIIEPDPVAQDVPPSLPSANPAAASRPTHNVPPSLIDDISPAKLVALRS